MVLPLIGAAIGAYPLWLGLSRLAAHVATAPKRQRLPLPDGAERATLTTEDELTLSAWLFAPTVSPVGTVVLGHGYRDDKRQLLMLVPELVRRGFRALALDFRAHGESSGDKITIGYQESRDVRAAISYARELGGPVGYVGFSMGSAAYLLAGVEADRAVLDSPYDSLDEAVGSRMDRVLMPRALASAFIRYGAAGIGTDTHGVRPIEAVNTLKNPTLVVFSRKDLWISNATRNAYQQALSERCEYWELPAGSHANHFTQEWVSRVLAHLSGERFKVPI